MLYKQVFSQWRSLVLPQNERLKKSSTQGESKQKEGNSSTINSIFQRTTRICFYSFPGDGEYLCRVQLHASALTRMVANHTLNSASYENSVTTTPIVGSALGLLPLSPMSY